MWLKTTDLVGGSSIIPEKVVQRTPQPSLLFIFCAQLSIILRRWFHGLHEEVICHRPRSPSSGCNQNSVPPKRPYAALGQPLRDEMFSQQSVIMFLVKSRCPGASMIVHVRNQTKTHRWWRLMFWTDKQKKIPQPCRLIWWMTSHCPQLHSSVCKASSPGIKKSKNEVGMNYVSACLQWRIRLPLDIVITLVSRFCFILIRYSGGLLLLMQLWDTGISFQNWWKNLCCCLSLQTWAWTRSRYRP